MISNRRLHTALLCSSIALLAGCPGQDDNSASGGITVQFAEVHSDAIINAQTAAISHALSLKQFATAPSSTVTGGYDYNNLGHHEVPDKNNTIVSIYRAYLVIDNVEMIECPSLAQLPGKLFNSLIGQAYAHAGHGSEPVGGRALDKPNVIDIITQDEYFLPLGGMAVAPGRYCGVRVALTRLASEGYGNPAYEAPSNDNPVSQPETPDMSGKIFAIRADYCSQITGPSTCGERTKIDIDDNGLTEPLVREIEFDQPLELSADLDEAYVAIGIGYGGWLEGVDASQLTSDNNELQKLLDNIAASLHVYEHGLGEIPANL